MDLKDIRCKITEIDLQIIDLLSKRMSLAPTLVMCKKKHNIAIFQPEREKQIHSRYWKSAVGKKINPELVRKIFELIITEMRNLQYEVMRNERS
ncbi:MAG: chorismate mutase [Candidatus Hodarchaeota archaeon]